MDNAIENLLKDMEELRKRILSINLPNAKENDLLWLVTSIEQDINKLEQPQGEWEENENGTGTCSNCYEGIYYRTPTGRVYMMLKEQIVKFGYKYCPNCGAKMKTANSAK